MAVVGDDHVLAAAGRLHIMLEPVPQLTDPNPHPQPSLVHNLPSKVYPIGEGPTGRSLASEGTRWTWEQLGHTVTFQPDGRRPGHHGRRNDPSTGQPSARSATSLPSTHTPRRRRSPSSRR